MRTDGGAPRAGPTSGAGPADGTGEATAGHVGAAAATNEANAGDANATEGGAGHARAKRSADGRAAPLPARLLAYQRERFPLVAYVPMITVFAFSAAAYSRMARAAPGIVPAGRLATGAVTTLVFFFLLRVLDEHKDAAIDRAYRPELPVPRGLVSLAELRAVGGASLAAVLALNLIVEPVLLWPFLAVACYAVLMTKEFFVPEWLRARPAAYLLSHMAILPIIDAYTTGLDWLAAGVAAPDGLILFLGVTYLNGAVVEIGRKIRAPADEREGVDTYTAAWGTRAAPALWLGVLAATAGVAWLAARHIGGGPVVSGLLVLLALGAAAPALRFLRRPGRGPARAIETVSGAWTIAMYLLLGAGPFAARALTG